MLSFSAGSDSTAMLFRMQEIGQMPDDVVFAESFMNYPEVYAYIKDVEKCTNRYVRKIPYNINFLEQFFKRGPSGDYYGFPTGMCPWMGFEKLRVLDKVAKDYKEAYIGFTNKEDFRKKRKCFQKENYRFPLIEWGWSHKDCINYLKRLGMLSPIQEIYGRTGDWCKADQTTEQFEKMREHHPSLFAMMQQLVKIAPPKKGFMMAREKTAKLFKCCI